jgi:2-polyprenyl-6-methoxyphenol hydroxylase-like FAD-dependent oxidoreductase
MRERLTELGGAVEFGCELVEFDQHDDGVSARLSGAEGEKRIRASYLMGADGGRSFVHISVCPLAGTHLFQLQAAIPLEGEVDTSAQGLAAMLAERTGRSDIHVESVSWASA